MGLDFALVIEELVLSHGCKDYKDGLCLFSIKIHPVLTKGPLTYGPGHI